MGAPVTLTVGAGSVQSTVQEYSGPNGTGTPEPDAGAIAYESDTPAVATVDPSTGIVTPVAPGTANISATDTVNELSDKVAVTVVAAPPPPNESLVLTIPTN